MPRPRGESELGMFRDQPDTRSDGGKQAREVARDQPVTGPEGSGPTGVYILWPLV